MASSRSSLGRLFGVLINFLFCFQLGGHSVSSLHAQPAEPETSRITKLETEIEKQRPLFRKLGNPEPGEWRSLHEETGQTFQEYLECDPTLPVDGRSVIYVQPLGEFTPDQRQVVDLTAEFLGLYFNLPVRTIRDLPSKVIPRKARRENPHSGEIQILTTYVLNNVLKPRLPEDAAAVIAITASDLWAGKDWDFVFGQASLSERVGVWSLSRNGDPSEDEESFHLCLLRTLKTATHETGHMFSMRHCIEYECNMCGSESLEEADKLPLALCPECLAKVCWATNSNPTEILGKLAEFCSRNGMKAEARFYRKSLWALR
jgi:archaemetzincin